LDLDDIAFAVNQSFGGGRKEERSDVGLRESKKLLVVVVVEYWYARAKVFVAVVVVVKFKAVIKRRRKQRATTFQRWSSGCFVGLGLELGLLLVVGVHWWRCMQCSRDARQRNESSLLG
jgi:hypothetical protein